jgi:periplasmic protein TonB
MRLFISSILSVCVSIGLFFGMQQMTSTKNIKNQEIKEQPHLVYLRDKKDMQINEKKRITPKKPEPKQPKKIDLLKPKMETKINKEVKIKPLVARNIDLSSLSALSGSAINVDIQLIDANTLQTISKIYPKFPRRAKLQRKEGFVQLQFKIDDKGYVSDPVVLSSDPKGYFEESALRAIIRWRFKPIKNGVPGSFIDATITFNYRLSE